MSLLQFWLSATLTELIITQTPLDVEVRLNHILPTLSALNMLNADAQAGTGVFVIAADKSGVPRLMWTVE